MTPLNKFAVPTILLSLALAARAEAQPMKLDVTGGGLGQTLTLTNSGPPGAMYFMLMSLTTGPSVLPGHPVGSIDLGLELVGICVSLPGFVGYLDGSGVAVLPLPVPVMPVLDNLNVNFQTLRVENGNTFVEKSNLWRVTFDTPGQYAYTLNNLVQARAFASVNALLDGTVLVAGGGTGSMTSATGLSSAELYRPNLEAFTLLSPMNSARALHRAMRLLDGRVLLTGGVDGLGAAVAAAEIFNPATGVFTATGSMSVARVGHTASLLPDGRVLIAGGSSDTTDAVTFATSAKKSTEIFNPSTGLFSAGPDLSQPKTFHEAVTLADGRVLISGGLTYYVIIVPIPDLSSVAQVYTPNAGSGSFGGNVTMGAKRAAHTAVLLNDGRALLVGGATGSLLAPTILATCELFNPASGFSAAGGLAGARAITSLVKLPAGQVLASGGAQGDLYNPVPVGTCELYTPVTGGAGSWAAAGSMNSTRSGHGCLILSDGSVGLIAGGGGAGGVALDTAEVYQP